MALLFFIFALVFLTELIAWIGQSVLLELVYGLHLQLFHAATAQRQKALKSELLTLKAELLRTSAQDQFAKWAKLRRSVDKGIAELEKLNGEIATRRTTFSLKFNTAIWVFTTGLQFTVGWWYRKSAVFYLPPGWLGPLGWWLALPFAPKGSVSVGVWQMACRRVLKVGERVVKELLAAETETEKEKEEPIANTANST
ncbi:Protein GET1 [Mycena indigotica]|uniref:Protein GET1 n=1 Tax=Mycena indigotica TaxID=2126181 RepID=A0A8H6TFG8_9AGAR|nr:Protein GET1 [Mycena indigotica]KAF7315787.1 Protein GET1 [Mycena indigotica]